MNRIRINPAPFDPGAETNAFLAAGNGAGAAVAFTGLVRPEPDGSVRELTLECYAELAEAEIGRMAEEATARFGLLGATIIHRFGTLLPGEPIVQVMTLALHRGAAFEAAEFLMDYLKTGAPFWKKETGREGDRWIAARAEDEVARGRWATSPSSFPPRRE